jgi:hypothetical protein
MNLIQGTDARPSSELSNYFPYDQAKAIGPTRKGTGAIPPMNGSLPMGLMSAGGKGIGLNFDHVLAKLQVSMIILSIGACIAS